MKKNPLGVGTGMLPNLTPGIRKCFALGSIDRKPWPLEFSNAFWKKMPATLSMIWLGTAAKTSNWLVLIGYGSVASSAKRLALNCYKKNGAGREEAGCLAARRNAP